MHIDWITVAAQIVNFLILVWLLQHFLYAPVVRAMQKREQHITDRLEQAGQKERAAERDKAAYERERQELANRREELLEQARQEAADRRKELEKEAQQSAEAKRRELYQQVEQERQRFLRRLRQHIAEQFERLARQALSDLADVELEKRVAHALADRLEAMDEGAREEVARSARDGGGELSVLSAYELPTDVRRSLTRKLHTIFGEDLQVKYSRSQDLVCGIEVRAGGRSVLWSLDSYLDDFETRMSRTLHEISARPQAETV